MAPNRRTHEHRTSSAVRPTFTAKLGSQQLDLPIVELAPDLAIALFITTDLGLTVMETAGRELAELLAQTEPEAVVTAATLGIPLGMTVATGLGLDEITVLHKTNKVHLADALTEPLSSITTKGDQVFRLDRARAPRLEGKRVVFVDDVISTGSSAAAALRLIRRAGGEVVSVGTGLLEGTMWQDALGQDAERTTGLGTIPIFRPGAGGWVEDWG